MMAQEGSELLFKFPEENSNQASPILPLHRLATDQLRGDLAQLLSDGGAIVYPTDTQYGIAVDPFQKKFFERLFTMKGRDRSQPVSLLVSRPNVIEQWAHIPAVAKNLMKKLWPGQLTLVLPRLGKAPEYWVDENGYIGFRHIAVEPVNKLVSSSVARPTFHLQTLWWKVPRVAAFLLTALII
jgi:tRNA threonylcarbamoyl adenosine modification protein (Sua5/YciO/YrdC/YwlC family)